MDKDKLNELYVKYELGVNDYYKHKHYTIITRQGINKIQARANIDISYWVGACSKDYCVIKAIAVMGDKTIETFGSALYGEKIKVERNGKDKWMDTGTTQSWYVMEIAEKRAMSRAVLTLTGFYEVGGFGEDESDDFMPASESTKAKGNKAQDIAQEMLNGKKKK
jgi:hypothetical protein